MNSDSERLREDLANVIIQLKTIFGVIPDAVRVFDADGTIIRFNAEASRPTTGGFAAGSPPRSLLELLEREQPCSPEGNRFTIETHPASRALRGERVRGEMVRIVRGDEEVIVEVSANPLRDDTGAIRGAVTVERDVTARARELDTARRAAEDARQELDERKIIERAKGILMRRTGASEEEAYGILRRTSQDSKTMMAEIARAVLESEAAARRSSSDA